MRLALIGDIHAFSLKLHPRRMFSRRIMGQSNLWLNRRFRFNHAILDVIFERVRALKPDKVLFSGDVTTTSLEDEFLDVERYLRPLSDEFDVVLVPGNHDRYTFRSMKDRRIERMLHGILPDEWPHFEELTPTWRLLALDSAMPGFMLSRGALGPTQFAGVAEKLKGVSDRDGVLVLCHYPVATPKGVPTSWAHALAEEKQLRLLLSECPARVVFLHGHIHKPWHWGHDASVEEVEHSTPVYDNGRKIAPFTCINAGSPCMTSAAYPLGQGFWQITLPDVPSQSLKLTHHVPFPEDAVAHKAALKGVRRKHRVRSVPEALRWEERRVL
jgi:3',5'-cyclic AMP phosphodiesterase CpdA